MGWSSSVIFGAWRKLRVGESRAGLYSASQAEPNGFLLGHGLTNL
jgi:hypothetical protein